MKTLFIVTVFTLLSLGCHATEKLKLDFGIVMHNNNGEPVGFKVTNKIPLESDVPAALYGLVVTRDDDQPFTLGSIHISPAKEQNRANKIMGKPMYIARRGAIFLRTDDGDTPGNYQMEVYIDNVLYTTIDYQLVAPALAKRDSEQQETQL